MKHMPKTGQDVKVGPRQDFRRHRAMATIVHHRILIPGQNLDRRPTRRRIAQQTVEIGDAGEAVLPGKSVALPEPASANGKVSSTAGGIG